MEDDAYITCHCRECLETIEFPVRGLGQEVECPHCHQVTKLYNPLEEGPLRTGVSSLPAVEAAATKRQAETGPTLPASPEPPMTSFRRVPFRHFGISWTREKLICGAAVSATLTVVLILAFIHRQAAEREHQAVERNRQAVLQTFRESLAAIKVCTKGSTYAEFRQHRLAGEIYYEANRSQLSGLAVDFNRLSELMEACDYCWSWEINSPMSPLNVHTHAALAAMRAITPSITNKVRADMTYEQLMNDPDLFARNYVRRALRQIDHQCDIILAELR